MRPFLKRKFRRLLRLGRAGRIVRQNQPFKHLELCTMLEKTDPGLPANAFRRLGKLAPAARTCLRQRLVAMTIYPHLLHQLMYAVAYPEQGVRVTAPPAWSRALRSRGIKVVNTSSWRWWQLLIVCYLQGLRTAIVRTIDVVTGRMSDAPANNYAVLIDLPQNTVPRTATPGFDFVSWYVQSAARDPRMREIWAHTRGRSQRQLAMSSVTVTPHYLPRLHGFGRKLRFIGATASLIVSSTLRGIAGQWWEVMLMEQLVDVAYAGQLAPEQFAGAYVFHSALWIVRPLWTHVAEQAGSRVDLVFYATNIQTFGTSGDQTRPVWPGYSGMSWPRFIVWDQFQVDFLRDLGIKGEALTDGPIGFVDNAVVTDSLPEPYVLVFDVAPQRPAALARRGVPVPYYTAEICWRFINETLASLEAAGFHMVYKKKREIAKEAAAPFRTRLEKLCNDARILAVNPAVAPQRLMQRASGVISMPFTSTALIARAMGKPSVYYDPLGVLVDEATLAHGVDVIGNRADLARWVARLQQTKLVQEPVS